MHQGRERLLHGNLHDDALYLAHDLHLNRRGTDGYRLRLPGYWDDPLNTGCATVGGTLASASDNAVLSCELVGACRLWRILVNCADQSLTAGTDTVNNMPACVCKPPGSAPGAANSVYVDPDPPMATFMTNQDTGALQPPACRKRSLTTALALTSATFTRVVAIHESSSSAHFTGETQPLAIPDGIILTTADGPSFNAAHYTIDLGASGPARVSLGNNSNLSGYTLSATGAGSAVDILGCRDTVPSAVTATADHLAIVGMGTQVGIAVRGRCTLTGTLIGVSGAGTGINVTHDDALTGTASFTGTSITANVTATGLVVANANSSATISSSATVASGLTVTGATGTGVSVTGGTATLGATPVTLSGAGSTGVSLTGGAATLTSSPVSLTSAAGSRGVVLASGTATLTTTAISLTGAVNAASRGILEDGAQAGTSVTMTGGGINLASSSALGALGLDAVHGTASLSGVALTVGGNTDGIRVQNGTQLTVNGASVLTTSCKVTTSDCDATVRGVIGSDTSTGIIVPAGAAQASSLVTVGGTTQISGFLNGIDDSGAGSLTVSGTVQVTGNAGSGLLLHGQNAALTTQVVNVTGATVSGNGNQGISVSTNIPTQVLTTTVSGNQSDGVNVAQSQNTTVNGYQLLLSGSTITGNGNTAANDGRGVFLSASSKVGVRLEGNHITGNVLEGVRVQGRVALSPTEVIFNSNHITGNLTDVANAPAGTLAGGVFFAGPGAIKLGQFIGNRVFGNLSNEIGFDVAQDISQGNPLPWDLSSDAAGVDMGTTCGATALPNYVYCYGATGQLGVAVNPATLQVKIKGMHWANMNPTGGADFTSGIPEPTVLAPEPAQGVFASCAPAGAAPSF